MPCHEIMKDLFFVERGYLNGNHFVYKSPEPILIDTGYIRDFDQTEHLIGGLDVDLSRVRLIINTHTHCDHVGGNKIIQGRSEGTRLFEPGHHKEQSWKTLYHCQTVMAVLTKCLWKQTRTHP